MSVNSLCDHQYIANNIIESIPLWVIFTYIGIAILHSSRYFVIN
ncbi:protein of unknown function [Shewanella benthica]|uniref:Uncharacterized protein n=1 Tax=Shewanella benthica TaxID=43661 RepID=A0A330M685_9GAMM|nr:protein of unknown function [Shewanella benthica]